jgi:hypothetical protein
MTALLDYDPNAAEALRSALGADTVVLPTLDALKRHRDRELALADVESRDLLRVAEHLREDLLPREDRR